MSLIVVKKVTIKELAEYCHVSTATISRVINDNGRFTEETRQRVNDAIAKLGYITNASGKMLRTQLSRVVGIFVNTLEYETTSVTVMHLQEQLEAKGYTSIICNIGLQAEREKNSLDLMLSFNACAIIMMVNRSEGIVHEHTTIPVVYLYKNPFPHCPHENCCIIETDDFSAGYQAGTELYNIGCRRIAEVRLKSHDTTMTLGRHLGLLQALYEHSLPYDESLSVVCEENRFSTVIKQVLDTLAQYHAADGYFCSSDLLALALIRALEEYHYRVPEDVKVIGCNDMSLALYNNKPITSIRHHVKDMCHAAVDVMDRMLQGQILSEQDRRQVFSVEIVRRATT